MFGGYGLVWLMVLHVSLIISSSASKKSYHPPIAVPYRYKKGDKTEREKPGIGEPCNYDHTRYSDGEKVNASDFDMECGDGARCEYVFDMRGNPIPLTTSGVRITVEGYAVGSLKPATYKTSIYYKKCMCADARHYKYDYKKRKATCDPSYTDTLTIVCDKVSGILKMAKMEVVLMSVAVSFVFTNVFYNYHIQQ